MNCANHPGVGVAHYCRTCGKPLCANCGRDVRGVIYCENCLADKLQGVQPPPYQPPAGTTTYPPPTPYSAVQSAPNPALAGILAGIFPFGVGAVYTGQYAKGLAHMIIFTMLVWGETVAHDGGLATMLGLSIAFFIVYQIIDSINTAKALQMGKPAPDPLGLGQTFSGGGTRVEGGKTPTVAIVLIGLGLLFLLNTSGLFEFDLDRLWPISLIGLGVWLFLRNWGVLGGYQGCRCDRCRSRGLMGPAILVTLGIQFLLASMDKVSFGRTLPALLIVIGLVKIFQSNASNAGHVDNLPPVVPPPSEMAPPPPHSSEVNNNV